MDAICGQCSRGKSMQSEHFLAGGVHQGAELILVASHESASATNVPLATASALPSWVKIVVGTAATAARCFAGAWASAFLSQ